AEDVSRGIKAILEMMRNKAPQATIVLTAIFPRNDAVAAMPVIEEINRRIARFADGRSIRWLNVNESLADASGTLRDGMMGDGRDPTPQGSPPGGAHRCATAGWAWGCPRRSRATGCGPTDWSRSSWGCLGRGRPRIARR